VPATPASLRLDGLKVRIAQLRADDTKLTEDIERGRREQDELTERIERDRRAQAEVRGALAEAETELVNAPVPNDVDPTEKLPDELLMAILIQVVTEGVCGLVCRRWHAVCQDRMIRRRAWEGRWEGYSAGWRKPQKLVYTDALAVGPDGTVYTASVLEVRAWSGTDGAYLRTLSVNAIMIHTGSSILARSQSRVSALAVGGSNGTVYGGCLRGAIKVWSGTDGSRLVDLEGHPGHDVRVLAVAVDGTLYSGSSDCTIRVWSNGLRVRTLIGHTRPVTTLAIGTQGKLYSGSRGDRMIRVWSAADGTHLSTLEGHTDSVESVAVGLDGTVYSGSWDNTVRVWAGDGGRPLRTLQGHTNSVLAVAVGSDGTIYSLSLDKTIRVWSGATCAVRVDVAGSFRTLVLGRGDKLYSIGGMNGSSVWW
jgi:hypothetical protein